MKKVAYTFIFGNYDDLRRPTVVTPGWDYICFTDDPNLKSEFWNIRHITPAPEEQKLENKKLAAKYKILPHRFLSEYSLSISADANISIDCDLDELSEGLLSEKDDMLVFLHPSRSCIYQEGYVCKELHRDKPGRINRQMKRYMQAGYPEDNGLYICGIMVRRLDRPVLRDMCELWFDEIRKGSRREQLSMNYAIWKSEPLKISEMSWSDLEKRFTIYPHKNPIKTPTFTRIVSRMKLMLGIHPKG